MRRRQFPKHVSAFCDRHGKERLRFRRAGVKGGYFTAAPPSRAFWDEYESFMAEAPQEPATARAVCCPVHRPNAACRDRLQSGCRFASPDPRGSRKGSGP